MDEHDNIVIEDEDIEFFFDEGTWRWQFGPTPDAVNIYICKGDIHGPFVTKLEAIAGIKSDIAYSKSAAFIDGDYW